MAMKLDRTDYRILKLIQEDATLSTSEIADRVGLTQSPTWRRISQMEEAGVIRRRVTLIDRKKVGLEILVYVMIRLQDQSRETVDRFQERVLSLPEVLNCHLVLGDVDFILLVAVRSLDAYHDFLREQISVLPSVHGVDTRLVLDDVKSTTSLPLAPPRGND